MKKDIKRVFGELVEIDSPSLKEREMADHIKQLFSGIGVELSEDDSARITGSNAGNLYACVEGEQDVPSVLFSAHMDTVEPAASKKAIFHDDGTITSEGTTVLGADDLAGVTAIYEAVSFIKENNIKHRTIEIVLSVAEEIYCKGASAFDWKGLRSREAYVLDLSGEIGTAAYAAPTLISFEAKICGKAAHAGFHPENGINSILAAARAIARLKQGHVDDITTANIGVISGGEGTNIVSESCTVRGEVRSLSHEKALEIISEYKKAFEEEAHAVGAKLDWRESLDIKAYETPMESSAVKRFKTAARAEGLNARLEKTFGGSDQNVFAQHGIEGLVIATSMNNVHSCNEYSNVNEIESAAQLLVRLAKA